MKVKIKHNVTGFPRVALEMALKYLCGDSKVPKEEVTRYIKAALDIPEECDIVETDGSG